MKLKKFAALALAGVMAVSMLAGCAGKGTTTDEGKTETADVASAVAAAVTEASYTKGSDLEKVMNDYILKNGTKSVADLKKLSNLAKIDSDVVKDQILDQANQINKDEVAAKYPNASQAQQEIYAYTKEAVGYYVDSVEASEEVAVKELAAKIDTAIENLDKAGYFADQTLKGDDGNYYRVTFTVTGNVGVYASTSDLGVTTYYMVYTIVRNGNSVKL